MHFSHLVKVRKNSHSLSLQAFLTHSHSLSLSLAGLVYLGLWLGGFISIGASSLLLPPSIPLSSPPLIPLHFPFLPLPFFLSLPSPSLPLEVGPLNPARRSGDRLKLPQRGQIEFGAFQQ